MQIDYLRIALALVVCLGLGVGAIFLLRLRQGAPRSSGPRELRLLDSLHIDPRTTVHVLEYREQGLVVVARDGAVQITPLAMPRSVPVQELSTVPAEAVS